MGVRYFLIVIMDQPVDKVIDLHTYCKNYNNLGIDPTFGLNQYTPNEQNATK